MTNSGNTTYLQKRNKIVRELYLFIWFQERLLARRFQGAKIDGWRKPDRCSNRSSSSPLRRRRGERIHQVPDLSLDADPPGSHPAGRWYVHAPSGSDHLWDGCWRLQPHPCTASVVAGTGILCGETKSSVARSGPSDLVAPPSWRLGLRVRRG